MIFLQQAAAITAIVLGIAVIIGLFLWLIITVYEGGSAIGSMIELTRSITNLRKRLEETKLVDEFYEYKDSDIARIEEQIRDNKVKMKEYWDIVKFVSILPVHGATALFQWVGSFFAMINILKEKE